MVPKKVSPARPVGMLLAPGAGAGSDQPALVAIDGAVTVAGLTVERVDFPYRLAGRFRPDQPAVLEETIRTAARSLADRLGVDTGALLLGGRSMGGRICSQVVAGGLPAAGLVLISYPLHPPGRPDKLRTAHFVGITVPCLFISGTRDAFATPEELTTATAAIPKPVTHVWIEGGDHSLRRRDAAVAEAVLAWLCSAWP
ncbi:MAG TPA: alpha/beta family hydrolase [Acidimicrobiales bacterium]|nr:alpha/beta family hydrolase [Acidimicrobiales bacterium]